MVNILLLISLIGQGQCKNSPTVNLSVSSGSTCGITPVTVSGNVFGGSATRITITQNGHGTLTHTSETTSPFSFTYTPKSADIGGTVIITVTTNNPLGSPCLEAKATYTLTVNANPSAPIVGNITQPTCTLATGSVVLSGLPSVGTWTLTRTPGGVTLTGSGTSTTISGLTSATYKFTVTNPAGCASPASSNVVIAAQPASPASPTQTIDCTQGPGKAIVRITGPTGTGLQYSLDASTYQSGTIFNNVTEGNHIITVKNSSGCTTTGASFQVLCTCSNPPTVSLSSSNGSTCSSIPVTVSGNSFGGSATSVTITVNGAGIVTPSVTDLNPFAFTYTPSAGDAGKTVIITITTNNPLGLPCQAVAVYYSLTVNTNPSAPVVGAITQPTCIVSTGSVILSGLPSSGTWTLNRIPGDVTMTGSGTSTTIPGLLSGTYNFTVTGLTGCASPLSSNVVIAVQPISPVSPTQTTDCTLGPGKATVRITSPIGAGLDYKLDAGAFQSITSFNNVAEGIHTITVRYSSGCTTIGPSFQVSCQCPNSPTVLLNSLSGSTCGTTSVTVNGNSFGGSATMVTITTNGTGTLTPSLSDVSPFAFTYTPSEVDAGRTVTVTLTTNNPLGVLCASAIASYSLRVNANPSPPVVGAITQPVCSVPSGSVVLNGLPANDTWILTGSPGGVTKTGTGTGTTISGLPSGTYTFTVSNSNNCISGPSANVVIVDQSVSPGAPVVGAITRPSCALLTGSVLLSGLPSAGTWTLIRSPGSVSTTGSGTSTTITALPGGTYTFTVTNSSGCISPASGNIVIPAPPAIPSAPVAGLIIPPTCSLSTGSIVLNGLPATGTWMLTRYPGSVTSSGTGTSITLAGIPAGTFNYTVTNSDGCVSISSANIVVPQQPAAPPAPLIGTITQPVNGTLTGSVGLNGLPVSGTWIIKMTPGNITTSGTGISITITGLAAGTYSFSVTNSAGCTSGESAPVVIEAPGSPLITITNPPPVCAPSTIDITAPEITAGSTQDLTYSYWIDVAATLRYSTPYTAKAGTYYIKGATTSGLFSVKPVTVTVLQIPLANAGPDQILEYTFGTKMDARLENSFETGVWSIISGSGEFFESTNPKTSVSKLSLNENMFLWKVTNGVCPPSSDTVKIVVHDFVIPSLITPNMDGRNDYFVLKGLDKMGKTELIIFNRRGVQVFKNENYDNLWNGVDNKEQPLPDDTYFYVLRSVQGRSASGFIVIRR